MIEMIDVLREIRDAVRALRERPTASGRAAGALGDRDSERVLKLIRDHPNGITKTQINLELFGGHKSPAVLDRILAKLHARKLISTERDVNLAHGTTYVTVTPK